MKKFHPSAQAPFGEIQMIKTNAIAIVKSSYRASLLGNLRVWAFS
jgi:hypothetical protein